ncbi:MAG: mRNA binding protein puf3 [Alyxoria varia]|nr:MAG: mRNA binding protein puf3 [Alyxoria varia]
MSGSAGIPQCDRFSSGLPYSRAGSAFKDQDPHINGKRLGSNDITSLSPVTGSASLVPSSESLPRGTQNPGLALSHGANAFANSTRNSPDRQQFESPQQYQPLPRGAHSVRNGWNGRQDAFNPGLPSKIRTNGFGSHWGNSSKLDGSTRSRNPYDIAGNRWEEGSSPGEQYRDLLQSENPSTYRGTASPEDSLFFYVTKRQLNQRSQYPSCQAQAGSQELDKLQQLRSVPSQHPSAGLCGNISALNGSNDLTARFGQLDMEDGNRHGLPLSDRHFPSRSAHLQRTAQNQYNQRREANTGPDQYSGGVRTHDRHFLPPSARSSGCSTPQHGTAYNFERAPISARDISFAQSNNISQYSERSPSAAYYQQNIHPFVDQRATFPTQEQRYQDYISSVKAHQPFNPERHLSRGFAQQNFPSELPMSVPSPYAFRGAGQVPCANTPVESNVGSRSHLLQHYKSHGKNQRWDLRDIYGHICEFAGDQSGSRFIQHKLEKATGEEKDLVFGEIKENAVSLMRCSFGNYVIQKLFEYGDQSQKTYLVECMKGKVLDLSYETYACRVVQKALDFVLLGQQANMVRELQKPCDVMSLVKDENGNHVMQKVIMAVPLQYTCPVVETFLGQIQFLATHKYGCRIVQRLLERDTGRFEQHILAEVHACAKLLIGDAYGNYTPQLIIEIGNDEDRDRLIDLVTQHVVEFSTSKYASNVVEVCLRSASTQQRQRILERICQTNGYQTCAVSELLWDQYGNYVIQSLLETLKSEKHKCVKDHAYFVDVLRPEVRRARGDAITGRLPSILFPSPHEKNELQRMLKQADNIEKKMEPKDVNCTLDTNVHFSECSALGTPGLTTGSSQSPLESALPSTSDMTTEMTASVPQPPRKDSGINIDVSKEHRGTFQNL